MKIIIDEKAKNFLNKKFGRVVYEHDVSGRMVSATAGDVRQEWVRGDGFVTEYLVRDLAGSGISHTSVGRDEASREIGRAHV